MSAVAVYLFNLWNHLRFRIVISPGHISYRRVPGLGISVGRSLGWSDHLLWKIYIYIYSFSYGGTWGTEKTSSRRLGIPPAISQVNQVITWVPVEVVLGWGTVWVSSVVRITSWVEHSASWGREGMSITRSCEVAFYEGIWVLRGMCMIISW